MAGSGERWRPAAVHALPRMRSRIPFRPSVFSALLIAALLAAAALIADTARADHFTGTGSSETTISATADWAPFGVMCITLGGTRRFCGDNDYNNSTHVCDMRGATITTYVDGTKYNGCRTDYANGVDGDSTDFVTDYELTAYAATGIDAIGPIPRCHDAFPKCPEGAAYKSTYIYDERRWTTPCPDASARGARLQAGGDASVHPGRLRP